MKLKRKWNISIFDQSQGLTPSDEYQFLDKNWYFMVYYGLNQFFFYLKNYQSLFSSFFKQKVKIKNFRIFDQNHGLTP